jgi:N-acetylglucosaminyldiphosphoundecaprenol N-acetyl-beta-D-mannosaminyltransferase
MMSSFDHSETIAGISFSSLGLIPTIELLAQWSREGQDNPRWIACVNPHSVEVARRDLDFKQAVNSADLVTADGTGIVVGSWLLSGSVKERVCGPDIFPMLCKNLNEAKAGTRMFFMGTSEKTLSALQRKFEQEFPHLVFAGAYAPPFRAQFSDAENQEMMDRINASKAHVLWVGLGAPKQEKWTFQNIDRLNVNLVCPVGGVFDFFTGRVKLPPAWAQKIGMIWLWRLIQQPRRLLRRNLDAPVFIYHVLKQRFFGSSD